jgi:hypothetical protein
MKPATALHLTIATLASAAPSVNDALLSARQVRCEYTCSCLHEMNNEVRNKSTQTFAAPASAISTMDQAAGLL